MAKCEDLKELSSGEEQKQDDPTISRTKPKDGDQGRDRVWYEEADVKYMGKQAAKDCASGEGKNHAPPLPRVPL